MPDASDLWVLPDRLFDGARLTAGQGLHLLGSDVVEVGIPPPDAVVNRIAGTVTPGFVDLQVNGGGGVLFNTDPSLSGLHTIAKAHRGLGTVAILPTVITDAPEVLERAADAVLAARGRHGIAGLHIEGPHISVARRGTHAERFVRPMDDRTLALVARLRQAGVPVMITLAPEAATPDQIAALAATGAVVSIGHSDASAEQVHAALAAGARCFTHLFNAMSPMLNRAPGVTGAAINATAHAGIICDGIHVADAMIGLALRARPVPDTTFLVSDAMPTVGGPDRFDLYGSPVRLRNGRLVNAEGSLAGAHVTMAEGVARLVGVVGIAPQTALRMAVTVPAGLMGLDRLARVTPRVTSDLLVLGDDLRPSGTLAEAIGTMA